MEQQDRDFNKSQWKMAMDDHIRNFLAQVSKDELVEMWEEVREQELDREYGLVGEEMKPAPRPAHQFLRLNIRSQPK